jgi:hypothetical protein
MDKEFFAGVETKEYVDVVSTGVRMELPIPAHSLP